MQVETPPNPVKARPRVKRVVLFGGAAILVTVVAYIIVKRRRDREAAEAAAAVGSLALEDPTVPSPDAYGYGSTMLSPISSGAAAGGTGGGGSVQTYTLDDLMEVIRGTGNPTGGGAGDPPSPNPNPYAPPPLPDPIYQPVYAAPEPAPPPPAAAPAVRRVKWCDKFYNGASNNCREQTTSHYSNGHVTINKDVKISDKPCQKPRTECHPG